MNTVVVSVLVVAVVIIAVVGFAVVLLRDLMAKTVEGALERFKNTSNEQLRANGAEFAEFSKRSISDILDPLRQRIKEYDEHADKVHQGNTTLGTELKGYVRTIMDSAAKIQGETVGFRNDLKFNNKFQGDFGEERLELVLARCGFLKGEDFVLQSGEDKKIPDCRLYDHLAKKILVIDSKMSWKSYSEGFASEDPELRAAALSEHVKSVRKQVDNLASKRYHETLRSDREGYVYAPFSIMFVPGDGALITAIEADTSLIQYAVERNVFLTSPLNLYNLLRLLRTSIGNFDFAENLGRIAQEAKHVIERIDAMFSEFEDLGEALKKAGDLHGKVMKRLTEGSAENKSSIKEAANNMIDLSVKHDKLKSRALTSRMAVFAMAVGLLTSGCLSIDQYYVPVSVEGAETVDFTGELQAVPTDMSEKELVDARKSAGYLLVGRADFSGLANEDWVGAMVDKGEEVKAEKIDYRSWYLKTENTTQFADVPISRTTVAPVWSPDGPCFVPVHTTDYVTMPYSAPVDYNQYHVYFFKKSRSH